MNVTAVRNQFDYIVVGGGSAGCVLASRLAARGSVALIEAGHGRLPTLARRPSEYIRQFGGADDWSLETEPQVGLANRRVRFPRGRGLGGSTRINASIWIEPHVESLMALEQEGGEAWAEDAVRSSALAIRHLVDPEYPRWLSEASQRFLTAATSAGYEPGAFERMNRRGVRRTAADVMLGADGMLGAKSEGDREVTNICECRVESILFDRQRAVGVAVRVGGSSENISATRGVILAAGAIHSPAILQRSGIGPRDVLERAGVACRVECEMVGEGLEDHLIVPLIFGVPSGARFPTTWTPRHLASWSAVGTGPVASNLAESGLFAGAGHHRVQLIVTPTDYLRHPADSSPAAMTIGVVQSSPHSRGRVWIDSPAIDTPPRIDPAYLTDERDLDAIAVGATVVEQIVAADALKEWLGPRRTPAPRSTSEGLVRHAVRFGLTLYHPCGTCRMGRDLRCAVDGRLRVRDVESLWVADASVLPGVGIANPNPLVMTLALHASAWIA